MKHYIYQKWILLGFLSLFGATLAHAGAGHHHGAHGHDHGHHGGEHSATSNEKEGSPNGGRVIQLADGQLEFYLTPERFVQITFLDDTGAVVPAADQVVSVIGGDRSAPTKLEFVKNAGLLRSTQALPHLKNMPIVLQIKATPDAKRVREKFYLNTSDCPSCIFKEYACVCGH